MSDWHPMLEDDELDGVYFTYHPVVHAIANGGAIESVKVGNEWTDDHCPCMDVTMVVDGTTYEYSDWWLSREGAKMYYKAECGCEDALANLRSHIIDRLDG